MIKMPRPFVQGNKLGMTIGHIASGYAGIRDRPLHDGERRLGGWILPPFQRPPVWSRDQQIKLVESIWLELPIGALVWNIAQSDECDGWLLDGQQRVTALLAYLDGEFPVFGAKWSDLAAEDKRRFDFSIPIAVIETQLSDPAKCREIYERLAYGGTPHEPKEQQA